MVRDCQQVCQTVQRTGPNLRDPGTPRYCKSPPLYRPVSCATEAGSFEAASYFWSSFSSRGTALTLTTEPNHDCLFRCSPRGKEMVYQVQSKTEQRCKTHSKISSSNSVTKDQHEGQSQYEHKCDAHSKRIFNQRAIMDQ